MIPCSCCYCSGKTSYVRTPVNSRHIELLDAHIAEIRSRKPVEPAFKLPPLESLSPPLRPVSQQKRGSRTYRMLTYKGTTAPMYIWAAQLGIVSRVLGKRLERRSFDDVMQSAGL